MYTPYTANDLVRVMEHDLEERHAARARRMRLVPDAELRCPERDVTRSRFTTVLRRGFRFGQIEPGACV